MNTTTAPALTLTTEEAKAFSIGIYSSGREAFYFNSPNPYAGEAFDTENGRKMRATWARGLADKEREADEAGDRWNDGALDGIRLRPKASEDPDYLEGYAHGVDQRKVRVELPARPEGYYHAAPGTFD